jgi:hypothetical protein
MRKEVSSFDVVHVDIDFLLRSGSLRLSLGGDLDSSLFGLGLLDLVLLDSLEESQSGVGVSQMLDSHVDFLHQLSLLDLLLDDHTDSSRVDVEDFSGSSVVELVGHSLVNGSVNDDIDVVSFFVLLQIVADSHGAVSSEGLFEFMLGSRSVSPGCSHVYKNINFRFINLII